MTPRKPYTGKPRGTAAMDPETRREVARKGGLAVSRNKQHMAEIGRKGGAAAASNPENMRKAQLASIEARKIRPLEGEP